ncbi:hypothetical protein [Frigoriglobus tundricola]|uniref:Uncharacterized protein n=1 Tax=Frigoriglobus tundricola TaxID=2774151 RepID=A0A6M5YGY8_9BACT|nr:hypothetical protein [Frigoriglobus tundricola]QJW93305.1 hypothetical protein FTUN_0811 [Frigoriglobus tundricola]
MLQKRTDDDDIDRTGELAAYETTRSATESSGKADPKKDEEHVSIFWRLFGGTILSIVALVTITLYNNMSSSISDLRADLSREREARAELVKKDEYTSRVNAVYERMRGIDTVKVELEGLKEKVSTNAAAVDAAKRDTAQAVEGVKKDSAAAIDGVKKDAALLGESIKKDAACVEVLKERVTLLEAIKKDVAGLDAIKERLASATADLKTTRDEVSKLTADVERNKTYDIERKNTRDTQYKQIDETLKELQKGLQACREKLARMEGSQPKSGDTPTGRPSSSDVKPAGGSGSPKSSAEGANGKE